MRQSPSTSLRRTTSPEPLYVLDMKLQPSPRGRPRRAFLRSAAATVALPVLPSLWPRESWAQAAPPSAGLLTIVQAVGTATYGWWPDGPAGPLTASSFPEGHVFSPLAAHRDRLLFARGLDNVPHAGGCDHHQAVASLLSGHPWRGVGSDAGNAGQADSVDTAIARVTEPGASPFVLLGGVPNASRYQTGTHDRGNPVYGIREPARAFEAIADIVGRPSEAEARQLHRIERGKSILDYVHGELCDLRDRRLSSTDRDKLNAYTEALRAVERDLDKVPTQVCPDPSEDYTGHTERARSAEQVAEYSRMLLDIGVLAAACGHRRAVTMYMGGEAPRTDWGFIGSRCGDHHGLSHHGCDGGSSSGYNRGADNDMHQVDRWHVENLFGRAVQTLAGLRGEDGDLLSQFGVLLISAFSNGRVHNHREIPCVIAGGMNGYFRQGALVELQSGRSPLGECNGRQESCRPHNSFLGMLARAAGKELDHFGASALPFAEHPELRP